MALASTAVDRHPSEHETRTEAVPTRFDRPTMAVGFALFLMTASFTLAKTGRDALYLQDTGIYDLPLAYIGMAVLSLPVAAVTLALMRWLGTRRARILLPLAVASGLLAYARVARPGGGALMTATFMAVPLAYGVLFSLVWLLGADLRGRQTASTRLAFYARVSAAALAGSLAAALVARFLASSVDPAAFLASAAATLVAAALAVAAAQTFCPRMPAPSGSPRPLVREIAKALARQPYFRWLLAAGVLAALTGILVEFQFYLAAASAGHSARENAAFFANLYLGLAVLAIGVQVLITPALQQRIGVGRTLMVLPVAIATLTPATILNPSLLFRSGLRLTEGGLKSSIHRVSWEQAFLPLPSGQRGTAKLLVEGAAQRIAEGAAALILYLWAAGKAGAGTLSAPWLSYLLLAVSVTWVGLTMAMVTRRAHPAGQIEDEPEPLEILGGPDCCPIVTTVGARVQTEGPSMASHATAEIAN
jgi:ATP:ADP antiporter, AAA family